MTHHLNDGRLVWAARPGAGETLVCVRATAVVVCISDATSGVCVHQASVSMMLRRKCVFVILLQESNHDASQCFVCDASAGVRVHETIAGVCVHETCAEVCVHDASVRECVSAMVWDGKEDTAHFWRSPHFQKWGLSRADINCAACFRDISVSRCWRDEPHHLFRCEQRHTHTPTVQPTNIALLKKTKQPNNPWTGWFHSKADSVFRQRAYYFLRLDKAFSWASRHITQMFNQAL